MQLNEVLYLHYVNFGVHTLGICCTVNNTYTDMHAVLFLMIFLGTAALD